MHVSLLLQGGSTNVQYKPQPSKDMNHELMVCAYESHNRTSTKGSGTLDASLL